MIESFEFAERERRDLAVSGYERAIYYLLKTDCDVIVDTALEKDGNIG